MSDQPQAPGLKEVREKLQYYAMNDKERHAYDEHINAVMIQNDVIGNAKREGVAEGIEIGMAKGMEKELEANLKKQLASAQSMLADGLPPPKK